MPDEINYFGTGNDAGDYSFLSNFYEYRPGRTVEHLYQAAKTDDLNWQERILQAPTPGAAKKLGRQAPMIPEWDDVKVEVMRGCLRQKFRPGSELADKLLATGGAILIEGNWWGDKYWGQVKGEGANWLGRLLMGIREELRDAS